MAKKPEKSEARSFAAPSVKVSTIGGKSYKRKNVTLPAIKLVEGQPVVLRVLSAIKQGRVMKDRKDKDGNTMKPAEIMDVVLLNEDGSDGAEGVIVCGKSIGDTLRNEYPNDSYVGKTFEFTANAKKDLQGGHTFRPVSIVELEAA